MSGKKKPKPETDSPEIELRPDGWERFEKAVDAAVKSGPKRRVATTPKPRRESE